MRNYDDDCLHGDNECVNKCKPDICCKDVKTRDAVIEFSDKCPVPLERLVDLNTQLCKAKKAVKIGWCQGQYAISLASKELCEILASDPKAVTDWATLLALIEGDAGKVCK